MKLVCKNVGWDGEGFYCMRCGKAGFQTEAQARGHLSQCKGRSVQKGLVPFENTWVSSKRVLPPAADVAGAGSIVYPLNGAGGAGGGAGGGQTVFPGSQVLGYPSYSLYWSDLDNRVRQLENEYHHLLLGRNAPSQDWLGGLLSNKSILILGLVIIFALLIDRAGRCPVSNDMPNGTKGRIGSLGDKVLNRITDKALTKSIDSIFG